jgi:FAD/FMN-containing dehydrogenase
MAIAVSALTGSHTEVPSDALEAFRSGVRGEVLVEGDRGYDSLRPPYNAIHPGHPALIVRATGVADVVATVNLARDHGLLLAVRGGGHSVAGLSSVDGGLLLDLELMNGVEVDLDAGVARVQGGALWGDVDHNTQAFGLVAPGGVVSDTGVAGLTLGGGEGWVRRKYGLSCDNVLAAQVVCADGEVRTASADTNPDLYWALRGGGGNFGVVTSFTFSLHPHGPTVAFAGVFYPADKAPEIWRAYRDWAATAPDGVTSLCGCTTLPASEHTPPEIHDTPFVVVGGVYAGDVDEGMRVMQPLREFATPLADISGPIPFTAVQTAFDPFFVRGTLRSYWKSTNVAELTDEVIDIVADRAQHRPAPRVFVITFHMGGAVNRMGPEDTAYGERVADWMVSIDGNWADAGDDEAVISWVRDTWSQVHKLGTGTIYLNFTGLENESTDTCVDSAYGRNLRRLAEIKQRYDPDNLFRLNNNITPA